MAQCWSIKSKNTDVGFACLSPLFQVSVCRFSLSMYCCYIRGIIVITHYSSPYIILFYIPFLFPYCLFISLYRYFVCMSETELCQCCSQNRISAASQSAFSMRHSSNERLVVCMALSVQILIWVLILDSTLINHEWDDWGLAKG